VAREIVGGRRIEAGLGDAMAAQGSASTTMTLRASGATSSGSGSSSSGRQHEGRAVGQDPAAGAQRQLAERELVLVDLQFGKAPAVGPQRATRLSSWLCQVAVVLLQVLRLQQHAFGPDHLVLPRHTVHVFPCYCLARRRRATCSS
jgi:hypothetical protein